MSSEPLNGRDPAPAKRRSRVVLGAEPTTSFPFERSRTCLQLTFPFPVSLAWPWSVVFLLEPAIEPFPDTRIDIEGLLHQWFEDLLSDNDWIAAGLLCKCLLVFRIMAHVAARLSELIHHF